MVNHDINELLYRANIKNDVLGQKHIRPQCAKQRTTVRSSYLAAVCAVFALLLYLMYSQVFLFP